MNEMYRITGSSVPVTETNLLEHIGEVIRIHGSVYKIRKMRGFAFVLLRCAKHIYQCVYSEEKAKFPLEVLVEESCVIFQAEVVGEERSRMGAELHLIDVEILSKPYEISQVVINQKEVDTSLATLLDYRPVTLRNEKERAVFRIQNRNYGWISHLFPKVRIYGNPYSEDRFRRSGGRSKYLSYGLLWKRSLSCPESAVL